MTKKEDYRLVERFMQLATVDKIAGTWCLQSTEEKKRRRRIIIALSQELGLIAEKTNFSTHLAELVIEAIIDGDWKMVEEWAEHFAFEDELDANRERYAPEFAIFRELLLQAVRTDKEPPV